MSCCCHGSRPHRKTGCVPLLRRWEEPRAKRLIKKFVGCRRLPRTTYHDFNLKNVSWIHGGSYDETFEGRQGWCTFEKLRSNTLGREGSQGFGIQSEVETTRIRSCRTFHRLENSVRASMLFAGLTHSLTQHPFYILHHQVAVISPLSQ